MERIECRFNGTGVWAELVAGVGIGIWIVTRMIAHQSTPVVPILLAALFLVIARYLVVLAGQRFRNKPIAVFEPSGLTWFPPNGFSARQATWDAVESVTVKHRVLGGNFLMIKFRDKKVPTALRLAPKGCSLDSLVEKTRRWSALAVLGVDPSAGVGYPVPGAVGYPPGGSYGSNPAQFHQPLAPAAAGPVAGWYQDPTGRCSTRYWDGTGWTSQVMDGPASPIRTDPI